MTRSEILDMAKKCVCGQREQDYGSPESNFQLIADLWNAYLGTTVSKDKSVPLEITPKDVAMMMALLKIARIKNGGGTGDSFVDLAGYAACGGELCDVHNEPEEEEFSNLKGRCLTCKYELESESSCKPCHDCMDINGNITHRNWTPKGA